jgi:hypothetical protein
VTDVPIIGVAARGRAYPLQVQSKLTDVQSYGWVLHDAIYNAVAPMGIFDDFTKRIVDDTQIAPEEIPLLGIYYDERQSKDGDINAGPIDFMHELRISISVMVQNNDAAACKKKLNQCYWAIFQRLWTDQYLTNLIDTYNPHTGTETPDNTRFEGVDRGFERYNFGRKINEMPVGEVRYEFWLKYRTWWKPFVPDNLEHIHFEARPKVNGYYDDPEAIIPVRAEWDMMTIAESPDYSVPPEHGTSTDPQP